MYGDRDEIVLTQTIEVLSLELQIGGSFSECDDTTASTMVSPLAEILPVPP